MTSGQKVAVSLLISVLIFAAFAVAAFAGLFSFVEARFYQPLVVRSIEQRLETVATKEQEYSDTLRARFASFVAETSVATYASARPTADEQKSRTAVTGTLFAETPALRGIRLIDSNGRSVHFSSFAGDVKNRSDTQISYRNYGELEELPFAAISCADTRGGAGDAYKILRDQAGGRALYAFPFYDGYHAYRGTMVFYCDPNDFNRFLLSQNLSSLSDAGVLVSDKVAADRANVGGYVFGLPVVGSDVLIAALLEKAGGSAVKPETAATVSEKIVSTESGNWIMFSRVSGDGGFVARLVTDDTLVFPRAVRLLLLAIVFVTLFLVIFLILNVRQDDRVIINDRIRRFQLAFVDECLKKQEDGGTALLPAEIASRRASLNEEIKASLGKRGKKYETEVNRQLDRSWNEILGALGVGATAAITAPSASTDTAELKRMLEEVLSSGTVRVTATTSAPTVAAVEAVQEIGEVAEEIEPIEEVAEIDAGEEVEETESVEELADDAEPLDEIEEPESVADNADAVEEIEVLEELADDAELLGTPEEIESVEEVEELAEDADEVEEPSEIEEFADDVEPLDTVEEIEPVEAVEELDGIAESADGVEPIEEIEEPDEIVELADDVESLDTAEEIEPIEELADGAESLGTPEKIEPIEELADGAESLGTPEEIEPIDEVEEIGEVEELADDAESLAEIEEPDEVNAFASDADVIEATDEIAPLATENERSADVVPIVEKLAGFADAVEPIMEEDEPIAEGTSDDTAAPVPSEEALRAAVGEQEDVPVLEAVAEESAFSFSAFGRNDSPVTEVLSDDYDDTVLPQEADAPVDSTIADEPVDSTIADAPMDSIVADEDGTFHIAAHLAQGTFALDARFKELVDSVLG